MLDQMVKMTQPSKDLASMNNLLYGFPKVGKTTLAAHFYTGDKPPLFVSTEKGNGKLSYANIAIEKKVSAKGTPILEWDVFKKVVENLLASVDEVRSKYSCIVVDLITDVDSFCKSYICNKHKVSSLTDLPFGKGFDLHNEEFTSTIRDLLSILPITFITHTEEREIQYNGTSIKTQSPAMSKKARDFICGKCDNIGFILPANKKNDMPMLSFAPSTTAFCGSRHGLAGKEFAININDVSATYKAIMDVINEG